MNQTKREPVRARSVSSVTMSCDGKRERSISRIASSQARSTSVTRSISPLYSTGTPLP